MTEATVVIIDDEPGTLELLKMYFEMHDFEAIVAQTGTEGIRAVVDHKPDAIILDLMLPDADGYQICRLLRHTTESKHTPIVVLSARTSPDEVVRGYRVGATTYFKKPVDLNKLLEEVRRVIEIGHVARPEALIEEDANQPPTGVKPPAPPALQGDEEPKSPAPAKEKGGSTVHIPGLYIPREEDMSQDQRKKK